jgi:hypothetical protein
MTPFYEARGRVAEQGHLEVRPDVTVEGEQVTGVRITVKDPQRMVRKVRFFTRSGAGADWAVLDTELSAGGASCEVKGSSVQWWVQLTNERQAVVAELGSEAEPLTGKPKPPEPVRSARSDPPSVTNPPPAKPEPRGPGVRIAGFVFGGLGVVAGGIGIAFGVQAEGLKSSLAGAARDEQGHVTGLTQRAYFAAEQDQHLKATVANILFIAGGVLAATGITLVIIGSVGEPKLALVPAGPGLMLSGAW